VAVDIYTREGRSIKFADFSDFLFYLFTRPPTTKEGKSSIVVREHESPGSVRKARAA